MTQLILPQGPTQTEQVGRPAVYQPAQVSWGYPITSVSSGVEWGALAANLGQMAEQFFVTVDNIQTDKLNTKLQLVLEQGEKKIKEAVANEDTILAAGEHAALQRSIQHLLGVSDIEDINQMPDDPNTAKMFLSGYSKLNQLGLFREAADKELQANVDTTEIKLKNADLIQRLNESLSVPADQLNMPELQNYVTELDTEISGIAGVEDISQLDLKKTTSSQRAVITDLLMQRNSVVRAIKTAGKQYDSALMDIKNTKAATAVSTVIDTLESQVSDLKELSKEHPEEASTAYRELMVHANSELGVVFSALLGNTSEPKNFMDLGKQIEDTQDPHLIKLWTASYGKLRTMGNADALISIRADGKRKDLLSSRNKAAWENAMTTVTTSEYDPSVYAQSITAMQQMQTWGFDQFERINEAVPLAPYSATRDEILKASNNIKGTDDKINYLEGYSKYQNLYEKFAKVNKQAHDDSSAWLQLPSTVDPSVSTKKLEQGSRILNDVLYDETTGALKKWPDIQKLLAGKQLSIEQTLTTPGLVESLVVGSTPENILSNLGSISSGGNYGITESNPMLSTLDWSGANSVQSLGRFVGDPNPNVAGSSQVLFASLPDYVRSAVISKVPDSAVQAKLKAIDASRKMNRNEESVDLVNRLSPTSIDAGSWNNANILATNSVDLLFSRGLTNAMVSQPKLAQEYIVPVMGVLNDLKEHQVLPASLVPAVDNPFAPSAAQESLFKDTALTYTLLYSAAVSSGLSPADAKDKATKNTRDLIAGRYYESSFDPVSGSIVQPLPTPDNSKLYQVGSNPDPYLGKVNPNHAHKVTWGAELPGFLGDVDVTRLAELDVPGATTVNDTRKWFLGNIPLETFKQAPREVSLVMGVQNQFPGFASAAELQAQAIGLPGNKSLELLTEVYNNLKLPAMAQQTDPRYSPKNTVAVSLFLGAAMNRVMRSGTITSNDPSAAKALFMDTVQRRFTEMYSSYDPLSGRVSPSSTVRVQIGIDPRTRKQSMMVLDTTSNDVLSSLPITPSMATSDKTVDLRNHWVERYYIRKNSAGNPQLNAIQVGSLWAPWLEPNDVDTLLKNNDEFNGTNRTIQTNRPVNF